MADEFTTDLLLTTEPLHDMNASVLRRENAVIHSLQFVQETLARGELL